MSHHDAELRRAMAGLIRWARSIEPTAPVAEIVDAEEALKMTPEQALADFRLQVEMEAERMRRES